jgi:hypothetical protein
MRNSKMTCQEFAEANDNTFTTLAEESYWEGGFNAEVFFRVLKEQAAKDGVTLSDVDEFSYESYFRNLYLNTEKGLS